MKINFLNGQNLVKQKKFGEALSIFLNLLKNVDKDKRAYFYLGLIYFELNNFDKSIFYYKKYLKTYPNSINTLLNLAIVEQSLGKPQLAKKIYLKIIDLDNKKIGPYYGLSILDINFLNEEHYKSIIQISKNDRIGLYEKSVANFILSKIEKKNKNYKKEIEYLKMFHLHNFNSNYTYNLSSEFYYKKIINYHYDKIKFTVEEKDLKIIEDLTPIFIIGLPRSGSTLIESILTSGSDKIKSCAESHVINMSILEQIGSKIYINDFKQNEFIFEINQDEIKKSILKNYEQFQIIDNGVKSKFIDKSLENFLNIEIILKIFPNAKFLHTFRNPADSVISIYQSMLSELSWAHKIKDILEYINNYQKIINHFKLKYPKKIMDINLEKFTHESENIAKKIYKFCDLKWNKKNLEFYKRNDLFSKTISFSQIRNKISKYDSTKYKPYIDLIKDETKQNEWLKI
jgi:tetratricopeptide (TPR) repeat protein